MAIGEFISTMGGVLLLLVGCIVGGGILLRRLLPLLGQQRRVEGVLRPLGLVTLTPQCSVALVQAGRATLVLGLTTQAVTLLAKIEEPVDHAVLRSPHAVAGETGEGRGS